MSALLKHVTPARDRARGPGRARGGCPYGLAHNPGTAQGGKCGLRHTHATILLTAREPVHVVSQRLGHASAVVTMTVYAHVLPGSQREAATLFARLLKEAGGA